MRSQPSVGRKLKREPKSAIGESTYITVLQ
jgi:hypothetical protein